TSVAAFAAMFRLLLTRGRVRPTRASVLATVYAANAMSVSVSLAGGGLASGRPLALVIAVPCVALAVIVAALIGVAARRPRLRAPLEDYLTQALKLGARLLRWPATDPMLALRAWAERFGALRIPPSTWVIATGDAL